MADRQQLKPPAFLPLTAIPINIEADKCPCSEAARRPGAGQCGIGARPVKSDGARSGRLSWHHGPAQAHRITAAEDVHIISENGREVFGDAAVYLVSAEEMTVTGNVRVISTKTLTPTLTGVRLIINLRNGTSRIFGAPKAQK